MLTVNLGYLIKEARKRADKEGLDSDAEVTTEQWLDLLLDLEACYEVIGELNSICEKSKLANSTGQHTEKLPPQQG
jgi:hypothetical protein